MRRPASPSDASPAAPRRAGRPRKAQDQRLVGRVAFRVTTAALDGLTDEAKRLGVDVSDLARQRTLSGRVTVQQTTALAAADRAELSRLGVNLNQLVRHLNAHPGAVAAVADVADDARRTLAQINAVLLRGGLADGP